MKPAILDDLWELGYDVGTEDSALAAIRQAYGASHQFAAAVLFDLDPGPEKVRPPGAQSGAQEPPERRKPSD